MADGKLVDLLEQGSEAWNAWGKQQTGDVLIDLSRAYLIGILLPGADLRRVNLSHAIIRVDDNGSPLFSDLCGADLHAHDWGQVCRFQGTNDSCSLSVEKLIRTRVRRLRLVLKEATVPFQSKRPLPKVNKSPRDAQ